MSEKDDGGPAFPGAADTHEGHQMREYGMSLRDWFAGQAIAGWLASFSKDEIPIPHASASIAYEIADALIAERNKSKATTTPETLKPPSEIHSDPSGLAVRTWPEGSGT